MRSIDPAGWTNHGFFGFGTQTFGNPGGATSGNGYFVNGQSTSTGPTFTNRGKPFTAGSSVFAMAAGSSILLAVDSTGQSWTSGNGSAWIAQGKVASGFEATEPTGILVSTGPDEWFLSAQQLTGNTTGYTTNNNGASWTAVDAGIGTSGFLAIGNNGANIFGVANDIPANPAEYGHSTNGGATWTKNGVTTVAGGDAQQIVGWDGSRWLIFTTNTADTVGTVWSSTDAENWTENLMTNGSQSLGGGFFSNGTYYAWEESNSNMYKAASLAALLGAAGNSSNVGPANIVLDANGTFYAFDQTFGVGGSTDFVTWTPGTLNMASGEFAVCCAYNNGVGVAGGSQGTICTIVP